MSLKFGGKGSRSRGRGGERAQRSSEERTGESWLSEQMLLEVVLRDGQARLLPAPVVVVQLLRQTEGQVLKD